MADANYSINIDGKGAEKTIKSLKDEAQRLASALEDCAVGSREFASTKKQLEKVNDELVSIQQTSLNIGDNIAKVGSGIIGGFQAGLGALTAFGFQSEAVNGAMEKMVALMSLSQGIKGIIEGVKSMKLLAGAIRTATAASKGLKVALAGTGIGLAVVAVGELVAHFEDIKRIWDGLGSGKPLTFVTPEQAEKIKETAGNLEKSKKAYDDIVKADKVSQLNKSAKERYDALTKELGLLEAEDKVYEDNDAKLRAEGAGWADIEANMEKSRTTQSRMTEVRKEINDLLADSVSYSKTEEEAAEKAEQAAKDRLAAEKAAAAEKKRIEDAEKERVKAVTDELARYGKSAEQLELDDLDKKYQEEKKLLEKYGVDIKTLTDRYNADVAAIKKKYRDAEAQAEEEERQKKLDDLGVDQTYLTEELTQQEHLDKMGKAIQDAYDQNLITEQQYTTAKARLAKEQMALDDQVTANNKANVQSQINSSAQAASGLASILGSVASMIDTSSEEGFEAAKKLQIAEATINMITGIATAISGAFTTKTGPWDIALAAIQAAAIAAAGAANIAQIKNTTFENAESSTASAATSTSAVNTTIVSPTQYSQEVSNATIEDKVGDVKVWVAETEIQRVGKKVSVAESESRY